MPEIESTKLKELHVKMLKIRAFEERAIAEYHKGLPGTFHCSAGQEAFSAGVCAFLREDDYVLSNHRGHGDMIGKGARLDKMMAELFAKETGYCRGKGGSMHLTAVELNFLGASGIVGGNIPIATGVALGCKMQNLDRVTICFLGDGATCIGAFHEGLGIAAVWDLPIVFACANNLYAMGTKVKNYTRLDNLADRAKAYGIPGVTVDGNDAVAVATTSRRAIEDARDGKGPTLIVGNTYRLYGHNAADPGTSYRTDEEVEQWKQLDPIQRLQKQLLQQGVLTESDIHESRAAVAREIDEAVKFAIESPEPDLEEALQDIYFTGG